MGGLNSISTKATRILIAKEIELGFLRIPLEFKKHFPKGKAKVLFKIDERRRALSYNSTYRRVFGLTEYFRKHKATPKDAVEITLLGNKLFELEFKKLSSEEKYVAPITSKEAKELINLSDLSSRIKGNIVEQRIGELIMLYGQGLLNVYKPIADIEGIDLIVVKKGIFQPLFIQVKSRYNLRSGNRLQIGIKQKGFCAHHAFFIVGAYFNPQKMDIEDYLVFIPSEDFQKKSFKVRAGKKNALYVLTTPLSPESKGKFAKFIIKKENLVNKIFEKFSEIEKYLK